MGRPRKPKEHAAVATAEELQTALTNGQIPEPEPGNETAPDAKQRRNGRPKAVDLPGMKGRGVELVEDAELEALGDELDDLRTKKRKLAEKITAAEGKALERMKVLGLKVYRWQDREMMPVEGKIHIKVKSVKVGDGDEDED